MVTNTNPQRSLTQPAEDRQAAQFSLAELASDYRRDGAMGMLNSVGNAMEQQMESTFSAEGFERLRDQILDMLPPEIREGLSQFFNMLSGAAQPEEPAENHEYQMMGETYGTGGAASDGVRMAANFAQRDDDSFAAAVTIGSGSGGFIMELNGVQLGPDGKPVNGNDEDEGIEMLRDAADETERAQRELREWQESMHRVGDVEMTGEEWGEFADMLSRDPAARRRMADRIKQQTGMNDADANKEVDQTILFARMQSIPRNQWTAEMIALDTELKSDPAKKQRIVGNIRDEHNWQMERRNAAPTNEIATAGQQIESVSIGADLLSNSSTSLPRNSASETKILATHDPLTSTTFASAPHLQAHYNEALAATEPLDNSAATRPQVTVAVNVTPMPTASAGLDI